MGTPRINIYFGRQNRPSVLTKGERSEGRHPASPVRQVRVTINKALSDSIQRQASCRLCKTSIGGRGEIRARVMLVVVLVVAVGFPDPKDPETEEEFL